jgi:hypothetical protein
VTTAQHPELERRALGLMSDLDLTPVTAPSSHVGGRA